MCVCVIGTSKVNSTTRDARTLRASPFIRDHQELMKHTERVIKKQTPTTAGPQARCINHSHCLQVSEPSLLLYVYVCKHACCARVCVCACRHILQTGLYVLCPCVFVGEIAAACMQKVLLSFLCLPLDTIHHLCGSAGLTTLSFDLA